MAPDGHCIFGRAHFGHGSRTPLDILRRSHDLGAKADLLAFDYAETAPFALFGVDHRLLLLRVGDRLHLDRVEIAPLGALLAPFAFVFVDDGEKAVRRHQLEPLVAGYREEDLAGVLAAITVAP